MSQFTVIINDMLLSIHTVLIYVMLLRSAKKPYHSGCWVLTNGIALEKSMLGLIESYAA